MQKKSYLKTKGVIEINFCSNIVFKVQKIIFVIDEYYEKYLII